MQSSSGISKAQWRKDAPSLLLAVCAVAFLPISVWMLRPRPLSAATSGELIALAREQTAEESLTILSQHEAAWNPESPESRWKEIERDLYNSDNDLTSQEVTGVLNTAKSLLKTSGWPIYAKRGWCNGAPVWIVAAGGDAGPTDEHPIEGPSAEDLRQEKIRRFGSLIKTVVIDSQSPYRLLPR